MPKPKTNDQEYNYESAGFNSQLSRGPSGKGITPDLPPGHAKFDNTGVSGSLGDVLQVGRIQIDGVNGAIRIFDDRGNQIGVIGELDA